MVIGDRDRATIAVALESYADRLGMQREQAARDRRRMIRWSESPRMGRRSREDYLAEADNLAAYIAARDERIAEVRDLIDRLAPEQVAA